MFHNICTRFSATFTHVFHIQYDISYYTYPTVLYEFTFKKLRPNIWEYFDAAGKLNQKSYVEGAGFGATANLFVRRGMFKEYGMFLSELKSGGDYEFGRRLTQLGEVLLYAETSLVYHPARFTFRDKLAKSKRVAKGQKMLERMKLMILKTTMKKI